MCRQDELTLGRREALLVETRLIDVREKRGSPWGELAPARATERGLQSVGI